MTKIVEIAHNAVVAKVLTTDRELKLEIQAIVSYQVAGAEQNMAFQSGSWNGRSSFFEFRKGLFPAGFVPLVTAHLSRRGYTVRRLRKSLPLPLGPENPKVDEFGEDPRYAYQDEVVERVLKHGQIIAQVATGGGKSRIAKKAYFRIKRPTLFLTTRSILMYQMERQFKAVGAKVGMMGDGYWTPTTTGVNVALVQTIMPKLAILDVDVVYDDLWQKSRRMKDGKTERDITQEANIKVHAQKVVRAETIRLLETFEFVILEEAHESSGNNFYDIMQLCRNAHYRLALTATPFMKDNEEANMRLMASSGPIGIKVTEKMLIDRGILAKPIFKIVDLKDKPRKLFRSTPWQAAYRIGITENEFRNKQIVFEAHRATRYGMTVMILVQHKAHGHLLQSMLELTGIDSQFIFGESTQPERDQAISRLKSGEIQVLIGSTILDVGVDVPAVGMIILAGGGKAEVALRQRIGRGLRQKKSGPNIALIVDFNDSFNTHLRDHAKTRRARIEETEGFVENILPAGKDFDFKALGLANMLKTAA